MSKRSKKRCPVCSAYLMKYYNSNDLHLHCSQPIEENFHDSYQSYTTNHYETFISKEGPKIEIVHFYPLKIRITHMRDCSYKHFLIQIYNHERRFYEDVIVKFGKWEIDKRLKKKFMTYVTFS